MAEKYRSRGEGGIIYFLILVLLCLLCFVLFFVVPCVLSQVRVEG